ncbi:PD-(D/E)XK nuclease family protein [Helicobacter sp. 11S03491-1]|uniref:PD-(D/E)XK nuclease family protein n=1 Tax=Helicobacter sp. 11S03491-1 TaxID=1476196 RepID=UPI000BA73852|nr:PD-(D/E)XK nuclease family protein [Helicobacter sp. 11S03491-1]PAF41885.1 hypothetical protein BKH45_06135 [Helicobacter sp. 11S03491-1]
MQLVDNFGEKLPLYVFATQRHMNEFYRGFQDGFLPQAMRVGEFFSGVVFTPFLKAIPKNIRKIFLLNIISKTRNLTQSIVFEKSFLGYLESSSFLFNFFDEMALFLVDISQIPLKDTYGDYEDHLKILFEIYEKYSLKLKENGFYDILKGDDYQILREYFENISCIEFYLDGFLSTQEKNILTQIAQIVPVFLHIKCDGYNISHFKFLSIPLEINYSYKIDFKTSEILLKTPMNTIGEIEIFAFSSRISQVALVFERINKWLESGIDEEKVAIITPDEDFVKYLKLLDKYNNLNFAMGKKIEDYYFVQMLKKELKILKKTSLNGEKHPLEWLDDFIKELLHKSGEEEFIQKFHDRIFDLYKKIKDNFDGFSYAEILELYLLDLLDIRIDDVSGGKVRVMGVLESRGLSFDRVVILDFNEHLVPSLKDSDMFLNTNIRKSLGIPTLRDRQDLQKHYYLQILKNTQKIDIAFVNTESASYSKMLDELDLSSKIQNGDEKYRIFPSNQEKIYQKENFSVKLPDDFVFSSSRLESFLACKRKFYYAYLDKLNPPKSTSGEVSSVLHQILSAGYKKYIQKSPDIFSIQQDVQNQVDLSFFDVQIDKLKLQIDNQDLEKFWQNEYARVKEGIVVLGCEKEFRTSIGGFEFIGRIDRIDSLKDEVLLIDYKLKKSLARDLKSGFQLAVYAHGARALGYDGKIRGYFYDLKEGKLKEQEDLNEKLEELENILKIFEDEIDFETTQEKKNCRYCPFTDICGVQV